MGSRPEAMGSGTGIEATMNYLSLCSGIEAASVAWEPLGFKPVGFSEIEKFPSQVLAHRFPSVRNYGDMTKYKEWELDEPIDILVGGTPCQSFSVAGLRKGLEDPRGNLALTYAGILDKFKPNWFVWENVPGVLSSGGGRDFGSFLGAVAKLGYGFAYRVLDAQFFGVPQRRCRVFVVGCLGGWESAAAVLFESESVCRHPATSREKGKRNTKTSIPSIANCLETTCNDYSRADGFQMILIEPVAFTSGVQVRKITPLECERLQGFPDGWTDIRMGAKPTPDGPRYKAIGNSMAVPVMRWIGERIHAREAALGAM